MGGRRPKPLAMHRLSGNARHMSQEDLSGANNPQPDLITPEMPKGMSRAAKREWKNIVPLLNAIGVLSNIDGKALAAYCESYALWETARNEYMKDGITFRSMYENKDGAMVPGEIKANPAVAIANTALKTMKTYLIEFGLTPASRSKLKIQKKDDGDEMDKFLKNKNASAPIAFALPQISPEDMIADDPEPVAEDESDNEIPS